MFILVKYKEVSDFQFPFNLTYKNKSHSHVFIQCYCMLLYNLKQKRFSLLSATEVAMRIPGILCYLQESHSEMLSRSQGSGSKDQSLGPHPARVPNAAGSCLRRSPPPATLQSLLQALRQVLSMPPKISPNPVSSFLLTPKIQTPWQLLGSSTENGMLPPVPSALSFFPQGPRGCSNFAPAPGPKRRAAGGAGGGRGGGGRGGGGPGGGGAGARGLGATFLQTTLPHAENTEISGALEGIASGRAGGGRGTTQVSPNPRPPRCRGGRCGPRSPHPRISQWLSPIPHFRPLNPGAPSPSPPSPPPPPATRSCCTFPSPQAPPPPRCTPHLFPARSPWKKIRPDEPKRGAAGVGARRKGEGEETYFSRRGAERCRREIKARIRAALNPANAVMSALQSGRRGRRRPPGPGTRAGDWRACGGRGAARRALALRSGRARLRAAPLLAPLWLLAPTPGSHMTPAPLALRASRGWRGK